MNENPYAELEQKYANNINQQNELLNQSEQIQNQQIDANNKFALDNIERQRGYAQKDFEKEARGAYQDYQKFINPYGVQAENLFSSGLGNSGYSETSKLNAFNTYQNRYATAKTSMDRLSEDFNNQMNQAILEANQEKAQVALLKLQTQMDNLWNQMNFDSSLTQNKVGYNQWLDSFNYQKEQDAIANQLAREQFEYQKQQDAISRASSSSDDYYSQMLTEYLNGLMGEEVEGDDGSGGKSSTSGGQTAAGKSSGGGIRGSDSEIQPPNKKSVWEIFKEKGLIGLLDENNYYSTPKSGGTR